MIFFKQKQPTVDVPETIRARLSDLEGKYRDIDARLLNVEHDAKALRDKVLRKIQAPREPEEIYTEAPVLKAGQPLRKHGITR